MDFSFFDDFVARIRSERVLKMTAINSFWLFGDRFFRTGLNVLLVVLTARFFGPRDFGLLNYASAISILFSAFATLGMELILVRDLVANPDQQEKILGTAFFLRLAGSTLVFFLTLIIMYFLKHGDPIMLYLVALSSGVFFFQAFSVIEFHFQAKLISKYAIFAQNAAFILSSLLKMFFLYFHCSLIQFAWLQLGEAFLSAVFFVFAYKIEGSSIWNWRFDRQIARNLLADCQPVILSNIALYTQARGDQIIIGSLLGEEQLGLYVVGLRLIEVWAFIPMTISAAVGPWVTQGKMLGESAFFSRLTRLYRLMMLSFLIIGIPLFAFGNTLVVLFFGEKFRAAGRITSWYVSRIFLTNFGVAKSLFLVNEKLLDHSLRCCVWGAILNVILNILLIQSFGLMGAVWAAMISFSVMVFFVDLFYERPRSNSRLMFLAMLTPLKVFSVE